MCLFEKTQGCQKKLFQPHLKMEPLFPTHWGGQEPNFNKCQLAKSDGSEEPTAFPLSESYFSSLNAQAPACIASSASTPLLFSHYGMSNSLWPYGLQYTRLPCPSLSPRVCSNLYPLSQWCYPIISSSATFFLCLQSFPASEVFFQWVGFSH